jgi:hypothetical protein
MVGEEIENTREVQHMVEAVQLLDEAHRSDQQRIALALHSRVLELLDVSKTDRINNGTCQTRSDCLSVCLSVCL